jgi:catechol 2,3-dioxygenase-like lactoylglutathione lyase family enzyme
MQPHLTHVALHVRDLDACIAFYRRVCGLTVVHERTDAGVGRVVWLAEPGRQHDFVFVMIDGGPARERPAGDFGHFGFACASRDEVDAVAAAGRDAGCLLWEPREEPFPVGYYCGLLDPDGNAVEFSFGQPLGPGAAPLSDAGGR